jgi:hypothetical protein
MHGQKNINLCKACLDFLYDFFFWNISHSKKNLARCHTCTRTRCLCNVHVILASFSKKILKYQILRKSVGWQPSCSMWAGGRTDRHDEANSRFSQFSELEYKILIVPDKRWWSCRDFACWENKFLDDVFNESCSLPKVMLSALKLDYVQCPILCSVHKFKVWTFLKRGSPPTNLWLYVVFLKTDGAN